MALPQAFSVRCPPQHIVSRVASIFNSFYSFFKIIQSMTPHITCWRLRQVGSTMARGQESRQTRLGWPKLTDRSIDLTRIRLIVQTLSEPVRVGRFKRTCSVRSSYSDPSYCGSFQVWFTTRVRSYAFQRPGYPIQIWLLHWITLNWWLFRIWTFHVQSNGSKFRYLIVINMAVDFSYYVTKLWLAIRSSSEFPWRQTTYH